MANLTHAELITPERVLFSGEAEAVVLRCDGGDTTFLANHMDYDGAVAICVVRIEGVQRTGASDGGTGAGGAATPGGGAATPGESTSLGEVRAAVHGGFVKVADNKVTIVAGTAELAEEIDVARAQRALEAAEATLEAGSKAGTAGRGLETAEGRPSGGDVAEADAAAARARVRLEAAVKLKADLSRM